MTVELTGEQVRSFEQDGFLIVDRVLDSEQIEAARAAMTRVLSGEYRGDRRPPALRSMAHPVLGDTTTRWVVHPRLVDETIWDTVTSEELGRAAAQLLSTRSVSVVEDQLLDKLPGGAPVATHQDYRYWQFSRSPSMLTCWIALDDVHVDNGTVEIIPGSHRWGEYAFQGTLAADFQAQVNGGSIYMRVADSLRPPGAEVRFVPVVVPAGGAAFFHSLTIHSSTENRSTSRRRALSIHYAAEECTVDLGKTVDQPFPYCFARLRDGDRLVTKYFPQVFAQPG